MKSTLLAIAAIAGVGAAGRLGRGSRNADGWRDLEHMTDNYGPGDAMERLEQFYPESARGTLEEYRGQRVESRRGG